MEIEHRDFKFGRQVDRSKYQPSDNKGAWWGQVNHINFGGYQPYVWTADARVVKLCTQVGCTKSHHKGDKTPL